MIFLGFCLHLAKSSWSFLIQLMKTLSHPISEAISKAISVNTTLDNSDDIDADVELEIELEQPRKKTESGDVQKVAQKKGGFIPAKSLPLALPPYNVSIKFLPKPLGPINGESQRFNIKPPKEGILKVREALHPVLGLMMGLMPFAILALWWFWATSGGEPEFRRIPPTVLPSPKEVVTNIPTLIFEGELFTNIIVSLFRVMAGFTIAASLAVPLGILMGASTRINATFGLMGTVLSYLPVPAVVPLTIAWWGTDEKQKIGFLALVSFAVILIAVMRSISNVDHKYVLSAYSQGASAFQVISKVLVPIAMPNIFNTLRSCLGIGWTYIVLVEVIKAGDGLGGVGNLIMVYHRLGHMSGVYLTVLAIMGVGFLLDYSCAHFGHRLFPYRRD